MVRKMKPFSERKDELLIEEQPLKSSASGYGAADLPPQFGKVLLEWKNISISIQSNHTWLKRMSKQTPSRRILSNVSGIAHPGSLLAIMGSSGCGKTTLLNALTMRSQSPLMIEGSILVNDRCISPGQMDTVAAYVQQDYLMPSFLTVKEQLTFQALLRMDITFSQNQKLGRVEEIIRELGLTKCQDILIGIPERMQGISGGERRRLAFASEILTDPPLIFCDEPTSGLDASMAQNVTGLLHKMATKGKTVICTIHQPSSYQVELFDRILLMAAGELAFLGTTCDALDFFSRLNFPCPLNYNPADHFINMLAGMNDNTSEEQTNVAAKICQEFAISNESKVVFDRNPLSSGLKNYLHSIEHSHRVKIQNSQELKVSKYKASIAVQLRVVMWRSWVSVVRNSTQSYARLVECLILAAFLSLIYQNQHVDQVGVFNISGLFGIMLCILSYHCIFSVVLTDSNDTLLFLREHWNGMYRTGVYLSCKFLAEIPSNIFFPFVMTFLPFLVTGPKEWKELLIFCAIILLVAASSFSFGYFTNSISSSIGEALVYVPLLVCPMLITSGIFIDMRSAPDAIYWIKYISWYNYAYEALSINQWRDVKNIDCNVSNATCPNSGLAVLDSRNVEPDNLNLDFTALAGLAVAFQILSWTVLTYRTYRKN